jgi:hypothetical protein
MLGRGFMSILLAAFRKTPPISSAPFYGVAVTAKGYWHLDLRCNFETLTNGRGGLYH